MKKAVDIKWNIDFEEERNALPTEMEIPVKIENDMEAISDYLSDMTGLPSVFYLPWKFR